MPSSNHPLEIGLAIAGGGVSGAAAVGVLTALAEAGIRISQLAGTSSGAVVAALYAYGYTPDQLRGLIPLLNKKQIDYDRRGIVRRLLRRKESLDGFVKGHRLRQVFHSFTQGARLEDIPLPLAIVATDLKSSKPVVFTQARTAADMHSAEVDSIVISDSTVADALLASCSIPVLFKPVRRNGYILVDGGVVMNCPVQVVKQMGAGFVLAVDTVTPFTRESAYEFQSALSIFSHVINVTLRNQMHLQHQYADLTFHPHVGAVGALDFHLLDTCIESGYRYAKEHMQNLLALLEQRGSRQGNQTGDRTYT